MRKVKYFVLAFILFILMVPSVFAEDAKITSTTCTSMTGGTVNSSHNVTIDGLDLAVNDVTFEDVGDYLKCEIVIINNSDDELSVDLESISNKSDEYITYSLTTNDVNKITNGESKKYNLDIEYIKEYEESKTIDNSIVIELSGGKIDNPATGSSSFVLMIVVLLIGAVLLIIYGKKNCKPLFMLVLVFVLIPMAYALTKITINMTCRIVIDTTEKYEVGYIVYDTIKKSEKDNYEIFDFDKFGVDSTECYTITGHDDYEVCAILSYTKKYAAGENVTLQDTVTYHAFNDSGELVEQTVSMNNTLQSNLWDYDYDDTVATTLKRNLYMYWVYLKDINPYDDASSMNFTGSKDDYWSYGFIFLYSNNSFTMPSHNVYFAYNSCDELE